MESNSHLVVLDVCGTIYDGNSTFDLIRFIVFRKGKKIFRYIFFFFLANYLLILFNKQERRKIRRNFVALFFRGLEKEKVEIWAKEFFESHYLKRCSFKKIAQFSSEKATIYLISASIDPPISLLSQHLNYEYYASSLEVSGGIYTGSFVGDILGKKGSIVKKLDITRFKKITLITDNVEDVDVIETCLKERRCISAQIIPRKNYNYWEKYFKTHRSKFISHNYIPF